MIARRVHSHQLQVLGRLWQRWSEDPLQLMASSGFRREKDLSESDPLVKALKGLDEICRSILNLDKSIKFVGIASLDLQKRYTAYREGTSQPLDEYGTERSFLDGTIRVELRRILENQLGDCNFIYAEHAKAKKITIPIRNAPGDFPKGIVELTLDLKSDEKVVIEKVMSVLKEKSRLIASNLELQQDIAN